MKFVRIRFALRAILAVSLSVRLVANAAQISVSSDGVPSFEHPIQLPPGAADLELKISIDYTASSANGVVGYGWSLRGPSMITRCASTPQSTSSGRYAEHNGRSARADYRRPLVPAGLGLRRLLSATCGRSPAAGLG